MLTIVILKLCCVRDNILQNWHEMVFDIWGLNSEDPGLPTKKQIFDEDWFAGLKGLHLSPFSAR